ncbi:hypothetical protein G6F58_012820 [Rhizopus delemar]|nr:hypothetical protein G6F58_012820 [Rhizopus delemar]
MNEAQRCDRMSLMHAGKVLVSASPAEITRLRGAKTLEEAFIAYLIDAGAGTQPEAGAEAADAAPADAPAPAPHHGCSFQRALSYMWRESLELRRDPVRATLALVGSLLLMFVMGYGISLDVEDLRYAPEPVRLPLLHRAATHQGLPGHGCAHAQRRAVAGDRDPAGFRPRCGARQAGAARRLD